MGSAVSKSARGLWVHPQDALASLTKNRILQVNSTPAKYSLSKALYPVLGLGVFIPVRRQLRSADQEEDSNSSPSALISEQSSAQLTLYSATRYSRLSEETCKSADSYMGSHVRSIAGVSTPLQRKDMFFQTSWLGATAGWNWFVSKWNQLFAYNRDRLITSSSSTSTSSSHHNYPPHHASEDKFGRDDWLSLPSMMG